MGEEEEKEKLEELVKDEEKTEEEAVLKEEKEMVQKDIEFRGSRSRAVIL